MGGMQGMKLQSAHDVLWTSFTRNKLTTCITYSSKGSFKSEDVYKM